MGFFEKLQDRIYRYDKALTLYFDNNGKDWRICCNECGINRNFMLLPKNYNYFNLVCAYVLDYLYLSLFHSSVNQVNIEICERYLRLIGKLMVKKSLITKYRIRMIFDIPNLSDLPTSDIVEELNKRGFHVPAPESVNTITYSDADLANMLRDRGYDVKCSKTTIIEL